MSTNLLWLINKIRKPEIYQGSTKPKGYFEGWYFKIVDKDTNNLFAIIPGISSDKNGSVHSFIQLFDGKACTLDYFIYSFSDWSFSTSPVWSCRTTQL